MDTALLPRIASVCGLRIGVPQQFFWDDCDPGITERTREALADLEKAGAKLVRLEIAHAEEAYGDFRKGGLRPPKL